MNDFATLNTNKEIMSLELQTDYLCSGVDGISSLATITKIGTGLPCDSLGSPINSFLVASVITWLPPDSSHVCRPHGSRPGCSNHIHKTITKTSWDLVAGHVSTMEARETEEMAQLPDKSQNVWHGINLK